MGITLHIVRQGEGKRDEVVSGLSDGQCCTYAGKPWSPKWKRTVTYKLLQEGQTPSISTAYHITTVQGPHHTLLGHVQGEALGWGQAT